MESIVHSIWKVWKKITTFFKRLVSVILEKDHSVIETDRLKNVVIFLQTILSFVLSRKIMWKVYGNYNMSLLMPKWTVLRDSSTRRDLYVFALLR